MGLNTRDCIEPLARLPIDCKVGDGPDSFVIIDPRAQGIMGYRMRKQSILFSHATHAPSIIAYKIRHAAGLGAEMLKLIERTTGSIDEVNKGLSKLK